MTAGGADPIWPCGPVLCREVEFTRHFHVQCASSVNIFHQEVKFAHGAFFVLQLDAVGAQAEMRTGFQPKCNQGFEMLSQQLSARF